MKVIKKTTMYAYKDEFRRHEICYVCVKCGSKTNQWRIGYEIREKFEKRTTGLDDGDDDGDDDKEEKQTPYSR